MTARIPATLFLLAVVVLPCPAAEPARLPEGAVSRLGSDQFRHGGAVFLVRHALGGKALLTASEDDTLRLWDAATGQELRRFDRPGKSENLKQLLGRGLMKELKALGFAEEADAVGLQKPLPPFRAAVSADGNLVAASKGSTVFVWDAATGKLLHQFKDHKGLVLALEFGSDNKTLAAVGSLKDVVFWDVEAGKKVRAVEVTNAPNLATVWGTACGMPVLTADLGVLAWQHLDEDNGRSSLKLHDLKAGKNLPDVKVPVTGVEMWAVAPDGKVFAWEDSDSGDVVVFDTTKPTKKRRKMKLSGDQDYLTGLRFSDDGKKLAATHSGRGVSVWDVATGRLVWHRPSLNGGFVPEEGGPDGSNHLGGWLSFSPDGKSFASSMGTARVCVWDAEGKLAPGQDGGHFGGVKVLGLCDGGKAVMTFSPGDGVRLWDAATGKPRVTTIKATSAWSASLSADGRLLATTDEDGAKVWDVATGKVVREVDVGDDEFDPATLSPDGKVLALRGLESSEVRLISIETGKDLCKAQVGEPFPDDFDGDVQSGAGPELVFSPDGRYLAGAGARQQLCLWRADHGGLVCEPALPRGLFVERFGFSGNGCNWILLLSNGGVRVYETATGQLRTEFGGKKADSMVPGEYLTEQAGLAVSPDGRLVALSRMSNDVIVWDLLLDKEAAKFRGHEGKVVSLAFSPDGRRLVSGSDDTTALVWDMSRLRGEPVGAKRLEAEAIAALWSDLEGDDPGKAFAALRQLSTAADQAAALVKDRVSPAAPADPGKVARLVKDLDDDRFEVRQAASRELESFGEGIVGELRQALKGELSLDCRRRLETLLDRATSDTPTPARTRASRAVELLEMAGGAEARRVLESLAKGVAEARLTREAKEALERMAGGK